MAFLFQESDFYLQGFWSDINYYLDDMEMLRAEFTFSEFQDTKNQELQEEMKACNSVSVHIRRGDYVRSPFDVTTPEYYKKAIEYLENQIQDPRFYFFSDDVGYIEQHFGNIDNKVVVDGIEGMKAGKICS